MVIWITGRGKSGKTTLARRISNQTGAIILAGEDIRKYFPEDFTREGRRRNLERIATFARFLEDQGYNVVISCQSPEYEFRRKLQVQFQQCIEIELPFGDNNAWDGVEYEETPVEYPEDDDES